MRRLACLGLAACALAAAAQDPLKSDACGRSLDALQAARAGAADPAEVEALRAAATRACLGGSGRPARPAPLLRQPLALPPPMRAPPPARLDRTPTPPAPPPAAPPMLTACDATGCWDSEGRRLPRVGPLLLGPRGPCTTTGPVVRCP